MLAQVQVAILLAVLATPAHGYSSYTALIPNGDNIGKSLGHTDDGYTDFGTMFSEAGTSWDAVCSETYPDTSYTCGEVLGDPCCVWTEGDDPQVSMTSPTLTGTTCASSSTTSSASTSTTSTTSAAASTTSSAATDSPAATPAATTSTSSSTTSSDDDTPTVTPAATTATDEDTSESDEDTEDTSSSTIPDVEDSSTYCS